MSTPALKGVCSESLVRLFLETFPGDPHESWPQALAHVHNRLLLLLQRSSSSAHAHTVHTL